MAQSNNQGGNSRTYPEPCTPYDHQAASSWHAWHRGHLEAWQRDGTGWRAFVRYSTETGMQHLEWVSAERVRENTP